MDQGVAHSHRITLDAFLAFSCPWGSEISTALKGSVARKTCFGESRHQFLQLWDSIIWLTCRPQAHLMFTT